MSEGRGADILNENNDQQRVYNAVQLLKEIPHSDDPEEMEILATDARRVLENVEPPPEWEIGVCERDDQGEWDWFHPRAWRELEALAEAKEQAREAGFEAPEVYENGGVHFDDF